MTIRSNEPGAENNGGRKTAPHLLVAALLTGAALALVSVVAGSHVAGLMALPGFGIIFGIEALRELIGWPSGESSIQWVGAALMAPTAFAVPTALSMRLDPSVPQTAMVAMVFLLPLLTIAGYLVLAGLDRWVRAWSSGSRWICLALVGLFIGGGLPTWVFVRSEIQEARVQQAQAAFLEEAEALGERWTLQMRVADVAPAGQEALVRSRDSVLWVTPTGNRRRAARLEGRGLPYLDAAQLDGDSLAEMIAYGKGFNDTLRAHDHDGSLLWNYATPKGTLGSVATTDLDGNGRSEIAVGSTTGGGLRLLSPSGRKLWADTTLWISDVRAVAGGVRSVGEASDSVGENAPRLYAATGEAIRRYRGDRSPIRSLVGAGTLRPDASQSGFALAVPPGAAATDGSTATGSTGAGAPGSGPMLVTGAQGPDLVGLALGSSPQPTGSERWRQRLPASGARLSAKGGYLAAVGYTEGRIYVFDVRSGEPVAASPTGRSYRGVEWIALDDSTNKPPVLLGWTEEALTRLSLPAPQASGR